MSTIHTPWGPADQTLQIAPGILQVATPSHGGIRLSTDRLLQLPPLLAKFQPWAGRGWYEEDQDWAIPAVGFPQHFSQRDIFCAVRSLRRGDYFRRQFDVDTFLQMDPIGKCCARTAADYYGEYGDHYERGSLSTDGHGWRCYASQIGDSGNVIAFRIADPWKLPSEFTPADVQAAGGELLARN